MAEPSRPPPPKAYVPLDAREGASQSSLFPAVKEKMDAAQPAIPPRPPGYDEHPVEKRKSPPPIPQPYVSPAGKKDEDQAKSLPVQRRPPQPSRPSRPPSVGALPSRPPPFVTALQPPLIPLPSDSNPPPPSGATSNARANRNSHTETTTVSAEPLNLDSIPSPTVQPTSPQARDVTPPKPSRQGKPKVMPPRPIEAPPPPPPPVDEDKPHQAQTVEENPEKELPLVRRPPPPKSHAPPPSATGKDDKKEDDEEEVVQQGLSDSGHPSSQKSSPTTNQAPPRRVKHLTEADKGQKDEEQETEEKKKRPRPPPPRTGPAAGKPSPPLSRATSSHPPQPAKSVPVHGRAAPPPPRTIPAKPPPPPTSTSTKKEMGTSQEGKHSENQDEENKLPLSAQVQTPPPSSSNAPSISKTGPLPMARVSSPLSIQPSQVAKEQSPEPSMKKESAEDPAQLASEPFKTEPAKPEPPKPVRNRRPNPPPTRPSAGPSRPAQPSVRPPGQSPLISDKDAANSSFGDELEPPSPKDMVVEKKDGSGGSVNEEEKLEESATVIKPKRDRPPSVKKPPPPRSAPPPAYPAPPPPADDQSLPHKNEKKEPPSARKPQTVSETEPVHTSAKEEESEEKTPVIKPRPCRPASVRKPPPPRTGSKPPTKPTPPLVTADKEKPAGGGESSRPGADQEDKTEVAGIAVTQAVSKAPEEKVKSSSPLSKRPVRPAPHKPSKPPQAKSASPSPAATTDVSTKTKAELSTGQTSLDDQHQAAEGISMSKDTKEEPAASEGTVSESLVSSKPSRPPKAKPRSQLEKPTKPAGPDRPKPPPQPKTVSSGTEGRPRPAKPAPPKPSAAPVIADMRKSKVNPDEPPALPPRPGPGHPLYRYVCSEPHGIALSNKESHDTEELSYQEGDVIELIEKMDDFWYLAHNADTGQEGMVLAREMKIIKHLPGQDIVVGFEEGPCAVATYDFQAAREGELSFSAGDLIMLKARVGDEWLRGQFVDGGMGIFPKSYVEVVEELPADAPVEEFPEVSLVSDDEKPKGPYCVAIETYIAETDDDLTFFVSDVIELVERIDDNWLKGRCGGNTGIFPQSFVQIERDLPPSGMQQEPLPGPDQEEDKATSGTTILSITGTDNVVKAMYEFEGQEGELSFVTGDSIELTARISSEWVYGKKGDKEGMFPASFVDKIPDNLPMKSTDKQQPAQVTASPTENQAVDPATGEYEALFDFDTTNVGELSFKSGEVIVTTEWIGDDWMYGKIDHREGMFPVNFVKALKELPKPTSELLDSLGPPSQRSFKQGGDDKFLPKAIALFDFEVEGDNEVSLKKGDTIFLLEKVPGGEWLVGENQSTMQIGRFPANFVDIITPLP